MPRRQTSRTLHLIILYIALLHAPVLAAPLADTVCSMRRLDAVRLPDLHTPRAGHQTLVVGDELMVVGGHTAGFVPTATAEFLRVGDTAWREQTTVYTHDFGAAAQLRSGEVLLMGGAAQPLGIGQTHSVERYDPQTRTFEGFGCLDTKRMYAAAEQLTDGRVLLSGNWYHDDGMELFDGAKFFTRAKDVLRGRATPFIFPIGGGDALIMGGIDNYGQSYPYDSIPSAERFCGAPVDLPLLRDWQPIHLLCPHPAMASLVGDTVRGDYSYLVLLENRDGDLRVALLQAPSTAVAAGVAGGEVTLSFLPGLPQLPLTGPEGQPINYISTVLVDREAQRGYVVGHDRLLNVPADVPNADRDQQARHYVFAFGVPTEAVGTASGAMLYYTDPLPGVGNTTPVLLPNGDIVLVGGTATDNFAPFGAAYRLPLGSPLPASPVPSGGMSWLWWLLGLLAVGALAVAGVLLRRRRRTPLVTDGAATDATPPATGPNSQQWDALMRRIAELMERERPYLSSELKVADVAARLGTNSRYVSDCIKAVRGVTFAQYLNAYRVDHAKGLLRQQPDRKLSEVCIASGFANETSFFRTFKLFTDGLTPREWLQRQE